MKTQRLLILFSLVVLGAYLEDKANAERRITKGKGRGTKYEVRSTNYDVQGKGEATKQRDVEDFFKTR